MIEKSKPRLIMLRFRTYNPNAIPRIIRDRPEYVPQVSPTEKVSGINVIPSTQKCDVVALMDDLGERGYGLVETQWRLMNSKGPKALYTWTLIYSRSDAVAKEGDRQYEGYQEFLKIKDEVDKQSRTQLAGKAGAVIGDMNCFFDDGKKSETENVLVLSCAGMQQAVPEAAMRMGEDLIVAPQAMA